MTFVSKLLQCKIILLLSQVSPQRLNFASYVVMMYAHCMNVCFTSSTLDSTVLPAAVRPDIEIFLFPVLLTAPVLRNVQGHRVLIVDPVALVMKKQHLGT